MKNSKITSSIRSTVFVLANLLKKQGMSLSAAFRRAWQIAKLRQWLRSGGQAIVSFYKPGMDVAEVRLAASIEGHYEPKGAGMGKSPLQFTFYDLGKEAVRSFTAARFDGWAKA